MQQIATITSKRQLTIPVEIFRRLNLDEVRKVSIKEEGGVIKIEPLFKLVNELAGSVKVPKRFKNLSVTEIKKKAKREYFNNKNNNK